MDIKEYRYILAIVEYGSISKAAEKLFISQPSLTTYIKNLEKRLGFQFFVEGKGKSHLTPEGELYVNYARQIRTLNDNLYRQLESFHNLKKGFVRMGITRSRATVILPKLLPETQKRYPSLQIEILEGNSREIEEALKMGELDFALLNNSKSNEKLICLPLREEEVVLIVPKTYQIQGENIPESPYPWVDIGKLGKLPFTLLKQGQRMREIADTLFAKNDIKPNIVFETSSATTAYKLSEAGFSCCFLLNSYLEDIPDTLDVFSIGSPRIIRHLMAARLKSFPFSKASMEVIAVLKEIV